MYIHDKMLRHNAFWNISDAFNCDREEPAGVWVICIARYSHAVQTTSKTDKKIKHERERERGTQVGVGVNYGSASRTTYNGAGPHCRIYTCARRLDDCPVLLLCLLCML